jgi:peptidoglycan hydrolase-like protein with peptidoglycan-binding domain
MNVLDIQRRLLALGFNPGAADGTWGPPTRAAVIAFRKSAGLFPDGVVGPKTIAAMNAEQLQGRPGKDVSPVLKLGEPMWVLEGRRKLGLRETNPAVAKFLKSDGRTVGDPSKIPWCGDFVETCIRTALAEKVVPTNPYLARNWLGFGAKCPEPVVGAIAVFRRGSKGGTQGMSASSSARTPSTCPSSAAIRATPSLSAASTRRACWATAGRSPPAGSPSRPWTPQPATSPTTRLDAHVGD